MFKKILGKIRAFLFVITAFAFWALFSLEALLENKPLDFQAAGSLVVCIAIFQYGLQKIKGTEYLANVNDTMVFTTLSYLRSRFEFTDSLTKNTFNLRELNRANLIKKLDLGASYEDVDEKIEELENFFENLADHESKHQKMIARERAMLDAHAVWERNNNQQRSWAKLSGNIELALLIFGTLQWGYGDRWVRAIFADPNLSNFISKINSLF